MLLIRQAYFPNLFLVILVCISHRKSRRYSVIYLRQIGAKIETQKGTFSTAATVGH